jgi:hypothetical protein
MEVDVRWCGDANICLGIELPVGGCGGGGGGRGGAGLALPCASAAGCLATSRAPLALTRSATPCPPPPSDLTRLNPKVTDIVFVATFKIILKPLVNKIPGFGGRCFGRGGGWLEGSVGVRAGGGAGPRVGGCT